MWNTCLIGRRWKPREGWSRPVLTGDGDTAAHSPSLVWGWVRVFAAAGLLATRSVVPVVTKRCSRPLSGSRTVTARAGGGAWVVFPFGRSGSPLGVRAVGGGFCGGHGPGVTPGPFPNPEAKAWHGDGTAPGRVWESNTPPQTFVQVGFPVEPTLRETPLFYIPFLTGSPWTGSPPREDSFLRSPAVGHRGLLRLLSQRGLMCFPEAQAGNPRRRVHKSNVWPSAICRRSSP